MRLDVTDTDVVLGVDDLATTVAVVRNVIAFLHFGSLRFIQTTRLNHKVKHAVVVLAVCFTSVLEVGVSATLLQYSVGFCFRNFAGQVKLLKTCFQSTLVGRRALHSQIRTEVVKRGLGVTELGLGAVHKLKHVLKAWSFTRLVLVRPVGVSLQTNRTVCGNLSDHVVALIVEAVVVHHLYAF